MARPPKPINWDLVEHQIAAGCNGIEIAKELRINKDTFYDRFKEEFGESFSDYSAEYVRVGESNLKFIQYAKAIGLTKKGDVQMLKWLGVHRLGQKESNSTDIQEATKEGTLDAIRELECERLSGDEEASQSSVEAESPLLDKRCLWQAPSLSDELGSERAL